MGRFRSQLCRRQRPGEEAFERRPTQTQPGEGEVVLLTWRPAVGALGVAARWHGDNEASPPAWLSDPSAPLPSPSQAGTVAPIGSGAAPPAVAPNASGGGPAAITGGSTAGTAKRPQPVP